MKKRILSVLLLTFLLVSLLLTTALAAQNEITVYNWGQYISDGTDDSMDVIKEFEAETGIKVNYLTFDSNESMYTKLKTGGTSYDVIIPSDYMIAKLISEDMLEPIDFANTPNYQYIDEAFRNQAYDPENKYSVPYTWGTVGLIYNTQYVSDEDAKSWSCLWNSKYAGKLLIILATRSPSPSRCWATATTLRTHRNSRMPPTFLPRRSPFCRPTSWTRSLTSSSAVKRGPHPIMRATI